ncbi:unnamed protein product [Dovyalis caffra]|uniref:Uncharacterized protein n=1 Tax=Dovyalis caffra TaxID=77055 RepID=A0AAV1RDG2_9ROSI|nr:unnamed protein product [Dovyalis caffra]
MRGKVDHHMPGIQKPHHRRLGTPPRGLICSLMVLRGGREFRLATPKNRVVQEPDFLACRKVKEVGDLMRGEQATEAPVNGGCNCKGPKKERCKGKLDVASGWFAYPDLKGGSRSYLELVEDYIPIYQIYRNGFDFALPEQYRENSQVSKVEQRR